MLDFYEILNRLNRFCEPMKIESDHIDLSKSEHGLFVRAWLTINKYPSSVINFSVRYQDEYHTAKVLDVLKQMIFDQIFRSVMHSKKIVMVDLSHSLNQRINSTYVFKNPKLIGGEIIRQPGETVMNISCVNSAFYLDGEGTRHVSVITIKNLESFYAHTYKVPILKGVNVDWIKMKGGS